MGLGIDFNPTAPRVTKAPKPRNAPAKPVRVQESRMTAAEAKPRPGMPKAFAEENATARRVLAEVSRPPPAVHWIIPGLDTDDGRAHPVPSGGPTSTFDVDAAMTSARAKAQAAFDRHVTESDYIRNTAAPRNIKELARSEQALVDDFDLRADLRSREAAKSRKAAQRSAQDLHGEVVRGSALAEPSGSMHRRGVAYTKPTTAPPATPTASEGSGRAPPRARLGATPLRRMREAEEEEPRSPPKSRSLEEAEMGSIPSMPRERRLASAIDWRAEPHIKIPERGADRLHAELAVHLADSEAELATMGRSSRAKTQLSEKVDYLKTQVARMAGQGGAHPVAADLEKLGLSADEADQARKLGFSLDGRHLKQHGQFRNAAYLRRALDEAEAGAAGGSGGSGSGGSAGAGAHAQDAAFTARVNLLEELGKLSTDDASTLARYGITVKKGSKGAALFYTDLGKAVSRSKVMEHLKEIRKEEDTD